jgi:hypothetical protein
LDGWRAANSLLLEKKAVQFLRHDPRARTAFFKGDTD